MSIAVAEGPSIFIGYQYRIEIASDALLFVDGATYAAQIRARATADTILATLTSGSGIERVSDASIELVISASDTSVMEVGSVVLDVVRTDLDPDQHMMFTLEIPVVLPVTRGL